MPFEVMRATITKIHPLAIGKAYPTGFYRVEFAGENGEWLKTDICPTYRNWRNWKPFMRVGVTLSGLRVDKDGTTIDADSPVAFVSEDPAAACKHKIRPKPKPPEDPQLTLL